MIMQESSGVILILRIFRFIKLRILVLRCPGNTIFGVLEALKFKIFRSSAPAPLGGGGGGLQRLPPNPPGASSLASLGRKDTSLRSDSPTPTQQRWLRGWVPLCFVPYDHGIYFLSLHKQYMCIRTLRYLG